MTKATQRKVRRETAGLDPKRFELTPERMQTYREAIALRRDEQSRREFRQMAESMTRDQEAALAALPYREFLETRYWRVLGRFVRLERGSHCERCKRRVDLQIHHLHYYRVGAEYRNLEDVMVLCDCCHRAEHGV